MRLFIKTIKSQQSGISLILSLVILVAIFGLVIAVADVAFDIRASNKSIGLSEKALFASESVIEWAIYEIEKDPSDALNALPPVVDQAINLPDGGVAYWDRNVTPSIKTPGLCGADIPKPVCTDLNTPVNSSNDLRIKLEDGQSFQLDLDLDLTAVVEDYPTHVNINITGLASRIIIIDDVGQETFTTGAVQIPQSSIIRDTAGLKFRLINESGGLQNYVLVTQGGAEDLPLGVDIDVTGRYQDVERQIRLTRPAWLIY